MDEYCSRQSQKRPATLNSKYRVGVYFERERMRRLHGTRMSFLARFDSPVDMRVNVEPDSNCARLMYLCPEVSVDFAIKSKGSTPRIFALSCLVVGEPENEGGY